MSQQTLRVRVDTDQLQLGPVTVTFHRTLRIPDDGGEYPLPASLGRFPIRRVEDYAGAVPEAWRAHGGVFLPMYQREAMWLSFSANGWRPNALKVAVGKVNALSGAPWSQALQARPRAGRGEQDYMVVPLQPWLDGINAGDGYIKQFVAMALGGGYTVEGQVTGREQHGGLQLCVFEPKPGRFPDTPPQVTARMRAGAMPAPCAAPASAQAFGGGAEMGFAAGGRMKQSIYPDPHGVETWDQDNHARVFVHLVNSSLWTAITGEPMPSSPVTRAAYEHAGYPWFKLYDEHLGDIAASGTLSGVRSVAELDRGGVAGGSW